MEENGSSKSSWLSVIIASISIPIIASSIAFITELAYFNYFKLPTELIEISFSNLFNSIIITFLILFYFILTSFSMLIFRKELFETNFARIFYTLILPIMSMIAFGFSLTSFRNSNYQILLFIFAFFILLFFSLRKYFNILIQNRKFPKMLVMFYIFSFSILLPLLFGSGKRFARGQKDFLVLKTEPERIILRMYKDIMIVAPFDRTKKEIDPTYTILKTPDIISHIKLERIGQMKVKEVER